MASFVLFCVGCVLCCGVWPRLVCCAVFVVVFLCCLGLFVVVYWLVRGWRRVCVWDMGYTVAVLGSAFFGISWGYIADKY